MAGSTKQGGGNGNADDTLLGHRISNRFEVLELIARGGMGRVYKAKQQPLGRICVLKILDDSHEGSGPDFHKRFFREAATAAKLTHANTVTIFDYGHDQDAGVFFIAMEYIDGKTLREVLREVGLLPEERVVRILVQMCRSLREAHNLGIVHRDIKPSNVLLYDKGDERDIVKVLDFGLVKNVEDMDSEDITKQGLFMGSPKYMAPEQILNDPVSQRTDIYSLGVVALEMLTGKCPFRREGSVKTLMAHLNEPTPTIAEVNPHVRVSPALEELVMGCLHKDPKDRYHSVQKVLAVLAKAGGASLTDTITGAPRLAEALDLFDSGRPPTAVISQPPSTSGDADSSTPEPMARPQGLSKKPKQRSNVPLIAVGVAAGVAVAAAIAFTRTGGDEVQQATAPSATPTPVVTQTATPAATPAPSPEVKPTATAAASQEEGDKPAERKVKVDSVPAGARVEEGGEMLCEATPCEVIWKGEAAKAERHSLKLEKTGYLPGKAEVGSGDVKVEVKLSLRPTTPSQGPGPQSTPTKTSPVLDGYKGSPY